MAVGIRQPEATSAVMRLSAEVRRIDRIEAKLMTWRDYLASGDPDAQKPGAADERAPVWIVAVSGEIVPQFGRGSTFNWGVFTVDGTDGQITSLSARNDGRGRLSSTRCRITPRHRPSPRPRTCRVRP